MYGACDYGDEMLGSSNSASYGASASYTGGAMSMGSAMKDKKMRSSKKSAAQPKSSGSSGGGILSKLFGGWGGSA